MRNFSLLTLFFFLTYNISGQCPNLVSADIYNIVFNDGDINLIPDTYSECNSLFPMIITIDNGSVYGRGSCGPTQLSYSKISGPGIVDPGDFTLDFGPVIGTCTYVQGTLSTKDYLVDDVKVFPNPVLKSEKLTIQLKKSEHASLAIFDITGKVVFNNTYKNTSKIELDVSTFNQGLYLLKINYENQALFKKVMVD